MKKILVVISIVIHLNLGAQWVSTNGPIGKSYTSVLLIKSGNALFAGNDEQTGDGVFKSTDDGNSWTIKSSGLGFSRKDVSVMLTSGSKLFVGVGYEGIFRSTNDGDTWVSVKNGMDDQNDRYKINLYVRSMMAYQTMLFAGTYGGGVFRSTDEGTTWVAVNSGITEKHILALASVGTNLFCGSESGLFRSTDNGSSWTIINPYNSVITALYSYKENLFISTWDGTFKSTDYGVSWKLLNTNTGKLSANVFASTDNILFAGGYLSQDDGENWKKIDEGLPSSPSSLILNNNYLFASVFQFGQNAGVWRRPISEMRNTNSNVSITKDWNILSMPVKVTDMTTIVVFPDYSSQTYGYTNGYVTVTTLNNGVGYWLKYKEDSSITVSGEKVNLTTVPLKAGWNLIGGYDWEVLVSGITTTPAGIISSSFYEYNKGYIIPTKLVPGKGYWIKVTADGVLNLPAASSSPSGVIAKVVGGGTSEVATEEVVKEGISIRVSDALDNAGEVRMVKETGLMSKYDLPPVPPRGIFETRWSSDRRVEKSGEGIKEIVISSAEYPVTLTVTGGDVRVKDNVGGMIINQIVKKGESIRIAQKGIERIMVEELEIPTEFRLCQNYPNPFNPETKIECWLPETGKITLKIYDVLGREVETLVDQVKEAGKYEIRWNASKYSSGVYFYNIINGNNHSVKKMLMIK